MRIVALNWRDPRHPEAGGAELHLREILRRCVRDGDEVTWLAEAYPGATAEDAVDGMKIVRAGTWYNAHLALGSLYRARFRTERVDLVVEDINKVPFFTPLYAGAPVVAVVPHLFGGTVFREASSPIGAVVWAHEALLPIVYRRTPFLAISDSTRDDLVRRGIPREHVSVVRCGLEQGSYAATVPPADRAPVITFLGRLRKYKGAQHVLRAVPALLAAVPDARLDLIGDGPYRRNLERLAARLGVTARVRFLGALSHDAKVAALNEAQVAVCPSPKEGWGLTVIEANACGAPVVASRSPGLVESVRDGETGILVPHGDVPALAAAITRLLRDRATRLRMAEAGLRWAATFDWEDCYRDSRAVLARAAGCGADG